MNFPSESQVFIFHNIECLSLNRPLQVGAKIILWILWQLNYARNLPIIGPVEKEIAGKVLGLFMPLKETVDFSDVWFKTLPMDEAIDDHLMPTCFAEMWFDMDRADGWLYNVLPKITINNVYRGHEGVT